LKEKLITAKRKRGKGTHDDKTVMTKLATRITAFIIFAVLNEYETNAMRKSEK
jgi:hypothetical protein